MSVDDLVTPHDHVVNIYDVDVDVVTAVTEFLGDGLRRGEGIVLIATAEHRGAIDDGLARQGVDLTRARAESRYQSLDAAELLATFMVDGVPARALFVEVVGGLLTRITGSGRTVRAFGEMVALLWDEGNVSGAIELESLWNDLARHQSFSLYCAYPMPSLGGRSDLHAVAGVCDRHSRVVPPASYTSTAPAAADEGRDDERTKMFVPVPTAVRATRRFVRDTLAEWGEEQLVPDAELVASELATNAVLHATSPFLATVRRSGARLWIGIHDISPDVAEQRAPSADLSSGRGLTLIADLSTRWGVDTTPDGKVVWAELG
ncbi:MAG: hypothetical protein QOJ03_876 [Frankiaceae bacterium]|nr:hypothetical protein [Frankiaceae bacterium]